MKSFVLTSIKGMELINVPKPTIKLPNEVLIRIKVVAVCGSDVHYYKNGNIGNQVVDYPFAVGHECAGVVSEIGKAVTKVKPGDRIAIEPAMNCGECDQCKTGRPHTCRNNRFLGCPGQAEGSLQEFIVMPESNCFPIPDNVSYDEAALSEPLSIGMYAVNQSGIKKDDKIGILGFGPIGYSVLLSANYKNVRNICVTDKINERCSMAIKAGAQYAGNPDNDNVEKEIVDLYSDGLDVVFECCGQHDAIINAFNLLKPGGKLIIIGIPEFDKWTFPVDISRHKEITIINIRRQNHTLTETLKAIFDRKIDTKPMVTHRFKFEESKKAFDLLLNYDDGVMKAIIDVK